MNLERGAITNLEANFNHQNDGGSGQSNGDGYKGLRETLREVYKTVFGLYPEETWGDDLKKASLQRAENIGALKSGEEPTIKGSSDLGEWDGSGKNLADRASRTQKLP